MKKVLLFFGVIFIYYGCKNEPAKGIKPQYRTITKAVYSTATIRPKDRYEVFAPMQGILNKSYVQEGDEVKENQLLFSIQDNAVKYTAQNAKIQVADIEQNLDGINNILNEQKLSLKSAMLRLTTDSIKYLQQESLWQKGIGSHQNLIDRKLAYEVSLNEVSRLQNQIRRTKKDLQSQLAMAKNNVRQSQTTLQDYNIKSNIAGKVYKTFKEVGEIVAPQTPLAIVGAADEFIIELTIDEQDIVDIKKGQEVAIVLDAFKDSVFIGIINAIAPAMDERSQTFEVTAEFAKAPSILYDGLNGEANIKISEKKNTLTIPKDYLFNNNQVYTADKPVTVITGISTLDFVEIKTGLDTSMVIFKSID